MLRSSVFRGISQKNTKEDAYDDGVLSFEVIYTASNSDAIDTISEKRGHVLSLSDIGSEALQLSSKNNYVSESDIGGVNKMSKKANGNSDLITVISDNDSNPSSDDDEVSRDTLAFVVESNNTKPKFTPRKVPKEHVIMDLSKKDIGDKTGVQNYDFELPHTNNINNNSSRASYFINNLFGVQTRTESAMDDTSSEEFVETNPLRSSAGRKSSLLSSSKINASTKSQSEKVTKSASVESTKSATTGPPIKTTAPSEVSENGGVEVVVVIDGSVSHMPSLKKTSIAELLCLDSIWRTPSLPPPTSSTTLSTDVNVNDSASVISSNAANIESTMAIVKDVKSKPLPPSILNNNTANSNDKDTNRTENNSTLSLRQSPRADSITHNNRSSRQSPRADSISNNNRSLRQSPRADSITNNNRSLRQSPCTDSITNNNRSLRQSPRLDDSTNNSLSIRQSSRLAPIKEEKLTASSSQSSSKKRVPYNERDDVINNTPRQQNQISNHSSAKNSEIKTKSTKTVQNNNNINNINNNERESREIKNTPRQSPRQNNTGSASPRNSEDIIMKPGQVYYVDKFSNTSPRPSQSNSWSSSKSTGGGGGHSSKSNHYNDSSSSSSSKSNQSMVSSKSSRSNRRRNNQNIPVISLGIPNLQIDNGGRISCSNNDGRHSNTSRSSSRSRKSSSRQELMNIPLAQRFKNELVLPSSSSSSGKGPITTSSSISSKSKHSDTATTVTTGTPADPVTAATTATDTTAKSKSTILSSSFLGAATAAAGFGGNQVSSISGGGQV